MRAPKGWGGVGAMAVLCVLALVIVLLLPGAHGHRAGQEGAARPVADGVQVAGQDCAFPERQTLAPSAADGPTIAAIKARKGEQRKLIVGVDQNSYRWGYRNPNTDSTSLEGFDIDLVHRIAKDILGDPDAVQFKAIPTDQRIQAIQDGIVDMVVRTMTITCDRIEQVDFSAPYFKTGQQVLAAKSLKITGYDDSLAGKKICTAAGSTALAKLTADKKAKILPATTDISLTVPNQLDCLVRLQLGEADAVVTDGALAAGQAAQDPTVELKGQPFTTDYYGVAMKKGADDLVRRVNQILAGYLADQTDGWQAAYGRWLSQTMKGSPAQYLPPSPPVYLRTG